MRASSANELLRDQVFRAVGDATRRKILELVFAEPGLTIQELASRFPVSRFAIMKHLNILEAARLIRREREGMTKRLFVERAPLVDAHRHWWAHFVRP